jgi:hypothetical protein
MGAEQFIERGRGETAEKAFFELVENAQWDYGHSGYTGTIAEKYEFKIFSVPDKWKGKEEEYADWLLNKDDDGRHDNRCYFDKWGPAGCLKADYDEWVFFGWASS